MRFGNLQVPEQKHLQPLNGRSHLLTNKKVFPSTTSDSYNMILYPCLSLNRKVLDNTQHETQKGVVYTAVDDLENQTAILDPMPQRAQLST
ncbi:hypothetical protein PDIG_02420 [Penicillium digitatum PHI26]|uniref:Uncharacterized protein n=2 Tax=Penicillium digitatum TaxID=36651 RepID=K9GY17_PEND2|nr:hypothetical protein PDIP_13710 [Penicillium digitatum Pd1]EKV19548.1 hypothetical protein PDIG_02420 [Penicillium digitatum PHI26]EKV20724.1 hypothetical protein PDIP_13710 [Penicillium digitatum Pd1]